MPRCQLLALRRATALRGSPCRGQRHRRLARGTTLVSALLASALLIPATASADGAPVPCNGIGNGRYQCEWWRGGQGAIVVRDDRVVGYLHRGSNWITCQARGAEVTNSTGAQNFWYGWTQADGNGQQGWASALDAKDGDDYGRFAGVPECPGHLKPPNRTGRWETTPATGPNALPHAPRPTPAAHWRDCPYNRICVYLHRNFNTKVAELEPFSGTTWLPKKARGVISSYINRTAQTYTCEGGAWNDLFAMAPGGMKADVDPGDNDRCRFVRRGGM